MACLFVYSTTSNEEEAATIARHVVEQRLAACANILPKMRSFYHWQGQIQNDQEVVMIFKTTTESFHALQEAIRALHSYECPCIVGLPITDGYPSYLKWIVTNVD